MPPLKLTVSPQDTNNTILADPAYSSGLPGSGASPNTSGDSSSVPKAPGYVSSVVSEANKTGKPHGKSISEDPSLDSDPKNNASLNSDIGGEQDPGRLAENEFQRKTQSASGSTAPKQKMGEGDSSQYDTLETDQGL